MKPTTAVLASLAFGCAGSVPLRAGDLERLHAAPAIQVVYQASPPPIVDCPYDDGERTWELPAGSLDEGRLQAEPLAGATEGARLGLWRPAAWGGAAAIVPAGTIWRDIQDGYTESLRRSPPTDPARATREEFLALARQAEPLPFSEAPQPVESAEPAALGKRFGTGPVLVFQSTNWVLVGCWYAYQPWFNVRATLLEAGSGQVLWRATCGRRSPPDAYGAASPEELEANGDALYARLMRDRASECAAALFASFTSVGAAR